MENNNVFGSNENQAISEAEGLPVDSGVMFTDKKGVHKKRIEKRQHKLLKDAAFVKSFLEPDETILLVTTGCSPMSLMEQMTTGWMIYYVKRAMFVVTDRRIFHVPATQKFLYRKSIAEIRYSDVSDMTMKGHVLLVKYNNGQKETFYTIARPERAKMKVLLKDLPRGQERGERTHLCPECRSSLKHRVFECDCGQVFKTRKKAISSSLIYPGGGYFYTGQHTLGVMDAFAEIMLMVFVGIGIVDYVENPSQEGLFLIGLFAVALLIEKLYTISHASHFVDEFLPARARKD